MKSTATTQSDSILYNEDFKYEKGERVTGKALGSKSSTTGSKTEAEYDSFPLSVHDTDMCKAFRSNCVKYRYVILAYV